LAPSLGPRRGCLAVASLPFLAVTAPIVALRRHAAVRRRGARVLLALARTSFGELGRVRCELDVPGRRLAEIVEALSGVVAEAAATVALTVGCVGIVPDEEPVLVALAPQRDLVAGRIRWALGAGDAHRLPQLWLTLARGTYLAQVVDPYVPFLADEGVILGLLRQGRVAHALLTEVFPDPVSVRIVLSLYAPRPFLRTLFSMARRELGGLPGLSAAR
jgi:hypothetical protein